MMMMKSNIISTTKAHGLYWLGRYVERSYISLHLLRRYYDQMIDDNTDAYEEFYKKLDVHNPYPDAESFHLGCLYDSNNPCSIISSLECANDNGIVLRREISTETLSYIQLSLSHVKACRDRGETNITHLQNITDYQLAFWGSVGERVFDDRIRTLIRVGRLIENIDMHIRFDYAFYRIEEAFESLLVCVDAEEEIFDKTVLSQLSELITEELYTEAAPDYRAKLLRYLNHVVLI